MRPFLLLSFAFGLVYPAAPQIKHGTVGVIYFTQQKISAAADSRGIIDQNTPPDDAVCKLAALGGDVVFVSAGAIRNTSQDPLLPSWDNLVEARSAYESVVTRYSRSRGHVREIADEWNKRITANFNVLAQRNASAFAGAADPVGGLTYAMLAGRDATGNLILFGVTISTVLPVQPESRANGIVVQAACPHHGFCAIGVTEIVTEFADQTSERARKEAITWKPPKTSRTTERDLLRTIRMVELTIDHHSGNDVGGPIDSVQLDRHGPARWHQLKPNCTEN
jgi:hypothetical protein